MTAEQWQRVKAIVFEARGHDPLDPAGVRRRRLRRRR